MKTYRNLKKCLKNTYEVFYLKNVCLNKNKNTENLNKCFLKNTF